ncbi:hypothetical protein [Goodfellowiella coeruleoviolacea]|uniref:SCO6045-like C-terminal domain-containing protein n=1 Tax=Goodfellowiella coeruleoviolacea TaxID=334858 RepID=A0AAE3GJ44_9PSEU|nr:hypothetical protein [Goodfellowiella coeruleoviolacea]MCP2168299.1 hypothetical protein [Goodfellowiella coeruleoviolacea]
MTSSTGAARGAGPSNARVSNDRASDARATEAARQRLAAQQAELLHALLAGGTPPAGFDQQRLRAEASALLAKRRGVVAVLRPDLTEALDERFRPLFDEFAADHPRRAGTRMRQDAAAFATWLVERGALPPPRRRRWWHPRPAS